MYSPNSSVLSTINDHPVSTSTYLSASDSPTFLAKPSSASAKCLRFKYFTTFLICTTCLALLAASLATHKWIVSRPIRVLRLNNAQTNFTSLMLTVASLEEEDQQQQQHAAGHQHQRQSRQHDTTMSRQFGSLPTSQHQNKQDSPSTTELLPSGQIYPTGGGGGGAAGGQSNNKFQGEVYFGLFNGVKVLNYGFGDRVSQISVVQPFLSKNRPAGSSNQQDLVDFKLWLSTLIGVALAILFALMGSIFAIINFVMTPRGSLTGPVGLVTWNAAACFSCLLALVSWLIEYFVRLKANILTPEEVQNGWTSENRSQFGYSYFFVVLAFVLHLVNIFIVSIVQFETWTSNKVAKRQSQAACEGVIMLY